VIVDIDRTITLVVEKTRVEGKADCVEAVRLTEFHYLIVLRPDNDIPAVANSRCYEWTFASFAEWGGDDLGAFNAQPQVIILRLFR
jgi:hypothetical protein